MLQSPSTLLTRDWCLFIYSFTCLCGAGDGTRQAFTTEPYFQPKRGEFGLHPSGAVCKEVRLSETRAALA